MSDRKRRGAKTQKPRAAAASGPTMSVEEAAELLGVGRDAAYQGVRQKKIPALRVGRYWRVLREPLTRMLAGEAR